MAKKNNKNQLVEDDDMPDDSDEDMPDSGDDDN